MKSIPYGKQSIDESDIASVVKVLRDDWLTQGHVVEKFEKALAAYCGSKYAVAVSSGTAALHLACLVSGLKNGDEAITSPMTFAATSNAVLYVGGRPIFADINQNGSINPDEIEKKITKRTKVVLSVHYAGIPCDMGRIYSIAKRNRVKIIEDAAHAIGARYRYRDEWVKVGSCKHSAMTIFSFHPVKHITTGEGGAITTNSKDIYEQLISLRSHGIVRSEKKSVSKGAWFYEMKELGFNYRLTDFQCALGVSQLKNLKGFIKKRKEIVKIYNDEFQDCTSFSYLKKEDEFDSSWHLYPILLDTSLSKQKKNIFCELRGKGVGVQTHYIPVYLHPYYKKIGYKSGICPKAENFYNREISLPIFPEMKDRDIKKVVKIVKTTV